MRIQQIRHPIHPRPNVSDLAAQISELLTTGEQRISAFRLLTAFAADRRTRTQTPKQRLEQRGVMAVEAHVQSHAFVAWCSASGLDINNQALLQFANEIAFRAYTGTQSH